MKIEMDKKDHSVVIMYVLPLYTLIERVPVNLLFFFFSIIIILLRVRDSKGVERVLVIFRHLLSDLRK